jgi:hypothetical protein
MGQMLACKRCRLGILLLLDGGSDDGNDDGDNGDNGRWQLWAVVNHGLPIQTTGKGAR